VQLDPGAGFLIPSSQANRRRHTERRREGARRRSSSRRFL
jgi:hypothetical protein